MEVVLRGGGGQHESLFYGVICLKNLLAAWYEFKRGKTSKTAVQEFEFNLENNLFQLHQVLQEKAWFPAPYLDFYIRDPKLRHIHKATVLDRVFNQALFRQLYPIFDKHFIHDSYSCRHKKGTHAGVLRLERYIKQVSANYTRPAYALKCDVRKFFDNINHDILFELIKRKVKDEDILVIIKKILESFQTTPGCGLPLGNVTSQLFANIYLNELDQFVKHTLKAKYYLRYCDDFIILDQNRGWLVEMIPKLDLFLEDSLQLKLHPKKIVLRKVSQGVAFLGYVVMPYHIVLRTKTKNRVVKKVKRLHREVLLGQTTQEHFDAALQSYFGMLEHCHGKKIKQKILSRI